MAPLPRELIRWMQMLSLPFTVRQPKRDLSNGYIFAEICARYWNDVELHNYENKLSTKNKESNWKALKKVLKKHNVPISDYEVEAVIEMKDDVAIGVLETLYTALTNRVVQQVPPIIGEEVAQVPTFIRSTTNTTHQVAAGQLETPKAEAAQEKPQQQQQQQQSPSPQKRARQAPKPKPPQKSGAIKAIGPEEVEEGAEVKPITFSTVTVKALAPQTLQRIGTADDRAATAGSVGKGPGVGESEAALSVVSSLMEKVLLETNTPPWPLSGATPTLAEYFSRNRASLSVSLKGIVWSRLLANASEIASYILSKPADCRAYIDFCSGAFVAADENTSDQDVKDNEKAKALLGSTLNLMFSQNTHLASSILSSVVMPHVASLLTDSTSAVKQRVASVLKSAVDQHTASTVVSHLHEALLRAPSASNSDIGFTTFLLTCHYFFNQSGLKVNRVGLHDASDDGAMDDIQLALGPILIYNAQAGLVRQSPTCRAAALGFLASMISTKHLPWANVANTLLQSVGNTLVGGNHGTDAPTTDLFVQSIAVLVASAEFAAAFDSENPSSVLSELAKLVFQIIAQLCGKSHLFESGVFTRSMRLYILKELGLLIPLLPSLVTSAGLSGADQQAVLSNFVDSFFCLDQFEFEFLLNSGEPTQKNWTLHSKLHSNRSAYCNNGATDAWMPLPILQEMTKKLAGARPEVSGDSTPLPNEALLRWFGKLVVERRVDLPLCKEEADLAAWWDLMKELVADVEAALYGAEIAAQRPKSESTEVAVELGDLANAIVYRFHVHLSGRSVAPAETEEELSEAHAKAIEWFRSTVVSANS